jgi:hypothetical protein
MLHTINFLPLNVSIQPTDVVYAALTPSGQAGLNHPSASLNTAPTAIGVVVSVNHVTGDVVYDDTGYLPYTLTASHYIFFSKDRIVNTSGIIGYFAETEYRNYTKVPAEIFATAVDYVMSSK